MDQREAPFFGALHTLAVDDGDCRTGFAAGAFSGLDVERMMDTRQRPVPVPQLDIIVDRGLRREVLGKRAPLAAGREHVEDRVQDLAHIDRARPPAALGGWNQRRDQRPLRIGEIARVTQAIPPIRPPVFSRGACRKRYEKLSFNNFHFDSSASLSRLWSERNVHWQLVIPALARRWRQLEGVSR